MDKASILINRIGALYRAPDLAGVLRAAEELCKPGRAWFLTSPRNADNQILVTASGKERVDFPIASQVEKASLRPYDAEDEGLRAIVCQLAGQFNWIRETTEMHTAYLGTSPIGVVGFTGSSPIDVLSEEMAGAIERLAHLETARQEAALFRCLLASAGEGLLAINESGRILSGTFPGRRLLRIALYGSPLSPYTSLEDALPAHILAPLLKGHPTSSHQVSLTAFPFREIGASSLIESPILIALRSVEPIAPGISPDRLAKLTPKQKEVLRCLLMGDRNKGIALKLGMSVFTARNHVSVILAALGCGDRLELIARYRSFNPTPEMMHEHHVVAPLANAPTVGDLPLPTLTKQP